MEINFFAVIFSRFFYHASEELTTLYRYVLNEFVLINSLGFMSCVGEIKRISFYLKGQCPGACILLVASTACET